MVIDIFNHEQNFHDVYKYYCLCNCIKQLFEYYGIKNAPLYLDFSLCTVMNKDISKKFGYCIEAEDDCILPPFTNKLRNYTLPYSNVRMIWEKNKILIDKGIPIIVLVDMFFLKYNHAAYKKAHGLHAIILCGYSEEYESVKIIDWYDAVFYKGEISIDELSAARASENPWDRTINSGVPINNTWYEVDRYGWECKDIDLVSTFLYKSKKNYFETPDDHEKCTFFGLNAYRELCKILTLNKETDLVYRQEFLKDLHTKLFWIVRRMAAALYYLRYAYDDLKLHSVLGLVELINNIVAL